MRFSMGVPVRTKAYRLRRRFTACAVLVLQFLMRWASSGFVEHDNIRREPRIYVQRVGHHLLIVDDGEKRRGGVLVVRLETADFAPENDLVIQRCELANLLLPLCFE